MPESGESGRRDVADVALARIQHLDLGGIDIEARHPESLVRDGLGQRQADIAEADDADRRLAPVKPLGDARDILAGLGTGRDRGRGRCHGWLSAPWIARLSSSDRGPKSIDPSWATPGKPKVFKRIESRDRLGYRRRRHREERGGSVGGRFLVTGGAGYVGSHLVAELARS